MKKSLPIMIILFAVLTAACLGKPEPDSVSLQLKWVHQAQFAGYYVAAEKGFYAEENIELTILSGGPGIDYFQVLDDGEADFAVVRPEGIFLERLAGREPIAIATIYRENPFLLISKTDSGITGPEDFPGKVVALAESGSDVQFQAMLKNVGVDLEAIEIVPFTFDYSGFHSGEVDVMPAFAAGSLLDIMKTQSDLIKIWPSDYGVHWYSDTIAVRDRLLEDNFDLVVRFLRATLRGHQYAIAHPEEAVQITMKYAEVADPDVQTAMLEASIPLINSGEGPIGWMDREIWLEMQSDLLEHEITSESIPVEEAFTLEVLEEVYTEKGSQ